MVFSAAAAVLAAVVPEDVSEFKVKPVLFYGLFISLFFFGFRMSVEVGKKLIFHSHILIKQPTRTCQNQDRHTNQQQCHFGVFSQKLMYYRHNEKADCQQSETGQ